MRILLLADYPAGFKIAQFLKNRHENIVGVILPRQGTRNPLNQGYPEKIIDLLGLPNNMIFKDEEMDTPDFLEKVRKIKPDLILSIFWGFLLKPKFYNLASLGGINLHLSYLPYNRGRNPNVWPIVDQTPCGVTLHFIDSNPDSGDIIAQSKIAIKSTDTGGTLYKKLVTESISLFKRTWSSIKKGSIVTKKQSKKFASHTVKDLNKIDHIDLDKYYKASKLINILRARTFPPFPSAFFIDKQGAKVYVRIKLTEEKLPQ